MSIVREMVTINDGHWLRETNPLWQAVEFYYVPKGNGCMIAIRDNSGYWRVFDAVDNLARGFNHDEVIAAADEKWATRTDDEISF
jgi:hypothetical protein